MLVQFIVENYRSFDHQTVLSMTASSDTSHPSHLINIENFRQSPLLRGVALYGANGAGKSNLLRAVGFASNLIVEGTRPEHSIAVIPFRLSGAERPTRFQFHFVANNSLYDYGFVIDSRTVQEEWLYATTLRKGATEQKMFERVTSDNGTQIDFGNALTGKYVRDKRPYEFVGQGTRPNQLFLTEAIERNLTALQPVWGWFKNKLNILAPEVVSQGLPVIAHYDANLIHFIQNFLKAAGTGVQKVTTEEREANFELDFAALSQPERERIKENCHSTQSEMATTVTTPDGIRYLHTRPGETPRLVRFIMHHAAADGASVAFEVEDESDGTQRLIQLLPVLLYIDNNLDKVWMLDELDRSLHPHLARMFIEFALAKENSHSQFIFTTHDTNLLDLDLLRRDEIWFAEKDASGASNLYSLAEFKVRPDLQIEKGYLNGRFGAIPFLGDLSRIGLEAEKAP